MLESARVRNTTLGDCGMLNDWRRLLSTSHDRIAQVEWCIQLFDVASRRARLYKASFGLVEPIIVDEGVQMDARFRADICRVPFRTTVFAAWPIHILTVSWWKVGLTEPFAIVLGRAESSQREHGPWLVWTRRLLQKRDQIILI
jgi:hypothetical protein